jgi:hypothetical protein
LRLTLRPAALPVVSRAVLFFPVVAERLEAFFFAAAGFFAAPDLAAGRLLAALFSAAGFATGAFGLAAAGFFPGAFARPRAARLTGIRSARARSRSMASARLIWSGGLPRGSDAFRAPSLT